MTPRQVRHRTQAELDADVAERPRPVRDTFNGMFPLHEDLELSDKQIRIVLDYLQAVNFHLPGSTPKQFLVVRWARYTGFQLVQEPLEAYAVGLRCTHPGLQNQHTLIRMSWGQLMGDPDAVLLPVNEPVLASDMMTLARYRDTRTGASNTGVDSYAATSRAGVPGTDFDLKLLDGALDDVLAHQATGQGREINSWWNPALNWGVALAGRYPCLKYSRRRVTPTRRRWPACTPSRSAPRGQNRCCRASVSLRPHRWRGTPSRRRQALSVGDSALASGSVTRSPSASLDPRPIGPRWRIPVPSPNREPAR